jgi:hypothetical protein
LSEKGVVSHEQAVDPALDNIEDAVLLVSWEADHQGGVGLLVLDSWWQEGVSSYVLGSRRDGGDIADSKRSIRGLAWSGYCLFSVLGWVRYLVCQ